ncbi:hypothetical protein BOS5A_40021 [Bosea sp. EC-HK365B]|nr:hypothetical protein BOSE7B_100045 [Bosea sp. 7B]CAD5282824.1 hypothetical protein BOSE21B_40021 [Bosea sp. 21B]VVT62291.1 hypothetical protein BOS5A_40021 [Bosea sp. EC-HK365B]VXB81297.1 hypothetical protein BOSE127_150045 [Bosea sp. 127]VXC49761.1 hypothetical protein BOSE29B_40134 [Bosea sp. 29B]
MSPGCPSKSCAKRRFSAAVNAVLRPSRWPTRWAASANGVSSRPSSLIAPASGRSRPLNMAIRLDLPAPLRPVSAIAVPFSRRNPTPSKIARPPRRQASPSAIRANLWNGICVTPSLSSEASLALHPTHIEPVASFLELIYRTRGYAARRSGAGLGHSRGGVRVMRNRPSTGFIRKEGFGS